MMYASDFDVLNFPLVPSAGTFFAYISTCTGWFDTKFCTDIHGTPAMSPDYFGDPDFTLIATLMFAFVL